MTRTANTFALALALALALCIGLAGAAQAAEFSYQAIAQRFEDTRMSPERVREATMQGECLVGLKEMNFRKQDDFDPVAEWTNYRSVSLLEQFPPCTVLVMMETARRHLDLDEKP